MVSPWGSIMIKIFILGLLATCVLSCETLPQQSVPKNDSVEYFENMDGCFLLYNLNSKKLEKVIGEENCHKQFPACSTFKVPLAVMAFDSNVLKDENVVLKWDGKKEAREESNQDHNAQTWMKQSIVWFSQRITPQIGKQKFQKYLNDFQYGNKDLDGGIQQAWLVSPSENKSALKISGYEQLEFMKKLWTNTLPASNRSMQLTREITYLETSSLGTKLSGKTGSNFYDKDRKIHLGWFISHIQNGNQEYIAITQFSDRSTVEIPGYGGPRAKDITKKILADSGLW